MHDTHSLPAQARGFEWAHTLQTARPVSAGGHLVLVIALRHSESPLLSWLLFFFAISILNELL